MPALLASTVPAVRLRGFKLGIANARTEEQRATLRQVHADTKDPATAAAMKAALGQLDVEALVAKLKGIHPTKVDERRPVQKDLMKLCSHVDDTVAATAVAGLMDGSPKDDLNEQAREVYRRITDREAKKLILEKTQTHFPSFKRLVASALTDDNIACRRDALEYAARRRHKSIMEPMKEVLAGAAKRENDSELKAAMAAAAK